MRRACLLAVLVGLVGAAAIASAAANPVVSALQKTAGVKTAVVSLSGSVTSPTGKVTLHGRVEQRGTSMHTTMTISSPVGPQLMEMIGLTERGRYVLYLRSPALRGQLPAGKRWIRLDAARSAQQLGLDLSSLTQSSPRSFASFARSIVATKRLGVASVGTKPATHYLVHIDLAKAAAAQPALATTLLRLRATGVKTSRFPLHVWVGKDGRVAQVRETFTMRSAGQRVSSSLTFRYLALNVNVQVSAPPRSLVVDA
jgi:hypothetical protein